jgi:hypothetical protein
MTFGKKVLEFYKNLDFSISGIPAGIEIMNPMLDQQVQQFNDQFYTKYYNDSNQRIFLIGINPGRFGGGLTAIPFTDPIHLEDTLKIKNNLPKRHELSSRFVYEVVHQFGGPELFFRKCYLTAVSPLGFVMNHKNINYYDSKVIVKQYEPQFIKWLKRQIDFGANTKVAFSLGRGKNHNYLNRINQQNHLFDKILALPHPRWVMQYRYKKRQEYVDFYCNQISHYL